jgi:hypothetical protein
MKIRQIKGNPGRHARTTMNGSMAEKIDDHGE